MLNMDEKIQIIWNGQVVFNDKCDRTIATLVNTISEREDADLAFAGEIAIAAPQSKPATE